MGDPGAGRGYVARAGAGRRMTPAATILQMLREVQDLRVVRVDQWARNFGRTDEEMQALFDQVRMEREEASVENGRAAAEAQERAAA